MPFGARKNIGLLLGVIVFAMGIVGIMSTSGVLGFNLPFSINILAWILAIGGFYLIIESITEFGIKRTLAIITALIMLTISLIIILNQFGQISFTIPGLSIVFFYVLLAIEGFFLIINAFGT